MTETQKPNNPLKIEKGTDHLELVAKYEAKIAETKQQANSWKEASVASENKALEKDKVIERLEKERDDWKQEALSSRKVYQEQKQHEEQNDFLTEFKKLQEKKGWQWDESQGWTKTK